jgi:hypothetical protein
LTKKPPHVLRKRCQFPRDFADRLDLLTVFIPGRVIIAYARAMESLLTWMEKQFPGENLTITAYAPSDPPLKIGTARLDASTRDMTYTPTRR